MDHDFADCLAVAIQAAKSAQRGIPPTIATVNLLMTDAEALLNMARQMEALERVMVEWDRGIDPQLWITAARIRSALSNE